MEDWKSNCLIIDSSHDAQNRMQGYAHSHGFGTLFCHSLSDCHFPSSEPDAVIIGEHVEFYLEEGIFSDVELLIRECQIPVLCHYSHTEKLIKRFDDVHCYHDEADVSHMMLSFVLSHARRRNIRESMINAVSGINQMAQGRFVFQSMEEAQALALLLASMAPHIKLLRLGLLELFINAVEHGNLEITQREKRQLRRDGEWLKEVEQRCHSKKYESRFVVLELRRQGNEINLTLTDQGRGFDWEQVSRNIKLKRNKSRSGRGLGIIQRSGLEKVKYLGAGNVVECSFPINSAWGEYGEDLMRGR